MSVDKQSRSIQTRSCRAAQRALPAAVQQLSDASVEPALPASPGPMCNKQLDVLVNTLSRSKRLWQRVLVLHAWLVKVQHQPDDRLCTTLIRACSQHGQHTLALDIFEWMRRPTSDGGVGVPPNNHTYTVAVRAALNAKQLHRAVSLWHDANAQGIVPDSYLCCVYMEVCYRIGDCSEVLRVFESMRLSSRRSQTSAKPPMHAYTLAMRAATAAGRPPRALEIWADIAEDASTPSGHAYAAAVSACAATGDAEKAEGIFSAMLARGVRADVVSCTALATALAPVGHYKRIEQLLAHMAQWNLQPNARTYTALISAYGVARRWQAALDLLHTMSSTSWTGSPPNAFIYSAVIKCLGANGQSRLAETVFSSLEAVECPSSAHDVARCMPPASPPPPPAPASLSSLKSDTCDLASLRGLQDTVIDGLAKHAGEGAAFTSLFSDPASRDDVSLHARSSCSASESGSDDAPPPAAPAYTPVRASKEWSPLFGPARARQPSPPPCPPGSDWLPVDLDDSPASPPALSSLSRPSPPASTASSNSLSDFVRAPARVELTSLDLADSASLPLLAAPPVDAPVTGGAAELLVDELTLPGVPVQARRPDTSINEVVCGALMSAYVTSGQWRETLAVLGRARLLGIAPNTVMYNTALRAAGRAGQAEVARLLFDAMDAPDSISFETLIAAQGSAGLAAAAEHTYSAMLKAGYVPRDYAFVGLVAAHSLSGDLPAALKVQQRMADAGVPASVHVLNAVLTACDRAGKSGKAIDMYMANKKAGVVPNATTLELLASFLQQQVQSIESQQATAAALSAAAAAVGGVLIRSGIF